MKESKKLVISQKRFKTDETTILSARIPMEIMRKIEDLASKTNRNRNEIVVMLLSYAVNNAIAEGSEEEGEENGSN